MSCYMHDFFHSHHWMTEEIALEQKNIVLKCPITQRKQNQNMLRLGSGFKLLLKLLITLFGR